MNPWLVFVCRGVRDCDNIHLTANNGAIAMRARPAGVRAPSPTPRVRPHVALTVLLCISDVPALALVPRPKPSQNDGLVWLLTWLRLEMTYRT
jgi:hypothetical protein